jgi:diguanylate cyclase (GGDEF)-like protein/putative nucleotidyltransferase with HDIG domain
MRFQDLPWRLRAYILAHPLVLAPVLCLLARRAQPDNWWLVAALLLFTAIFSTWKVELSVFQGRMTPTFAVVCLALLLQGLHAAVICAALGAVVGSLVQAPSGSWKLKLVRTRSYHVFFNVANCTLACAVAGLLFHSLAELLPSSPLFAVVDLAVFTGVYFLVNTLGISRALAYRQNLALGGVWKENFAWTAPGFFASASAAVGIETAFHHMGFLSLLFLPPLYWIYHSYRAHVAHMQQFNRLNQAIITSLAMAIEAKDHYTCTHINRVQQYAVGLARAAGLEGPELEAVTIGALVHDIGKLGIPDHILAKPGKLTPEEFQRVQSHVTIGAQILEPVPFTCPVVDVVLTHHERWDGLGYPNSLKEEAIPIGGRIIAIADVFDALTSNRPYRKALMYDEALNVLRDGAGKQFDPRLIHLFEQALPDIRVEIEKMEAEQRVEADEQGTPAEEHSALDRISQAASEMAAVLGVAQSLVERESLEEAIRMVVDRTLALVPADTAVLYLKKPGETELVAAAAHGKYADRLEGMTMQVGEGVAGSVAENGQPRINVSATLDVARRFKPEETVELSTATAMPLVHGAETLGVLAVYTVAYTGLPAHHVHVLNILAEHATAAIQNLRRLEWNQELAFTDPLTGLANSRCLTRHLERLTHRPGPAGADAESPFSVVMLDLDAFKQVNDTLGHMRGDRLLRLVAELLTALLRANDLVCRYAGDEFVLVLAGATPEIAETVARRVRKAIDALPAVDGRVRVGASVGVACFPQDGTDGLSLLHAADRRMYEDKYRRTLRRRIPAALAASESPVGVGG